MKIDNKLKYDLMVNRVKLSENTKQFFTKKIREKFYNDDYVTTTGIMLDISPRGGESMLQHI